MPAKNDFVRASRYDIARAVERWGGLYEVRVQHREAHGLFYPSWVHALQHGPQPCMLPLHTMLDAFPAMQLAEELGYAVETRKPGTSEWQEHISEVAASTGLSGRQVRCSSP